MRQPVAGRGIGVDAKARSGSERDGEVDFFRFVLGALLGHYRIQHAFYRVGREIASSIGCSEPSMLTMGSLGDAQMQIGRSVLARKLKAR